MQTPKPTRRNVLLATGTTLLSGGLLAGSTPTARATASIQGLEIPDTTLVAESPDPAINLQLNYTYDSGGKDVSMLAFGITIDGTQITENALSTDAQALEESTSLQARVLESDAWTQSDFTVSQGESVTNDVQVRVYMEVHGTDGVLVSTEETTTVAITVSHPNQATASVSGNGTVVDLNAK